MCEALGVSGGDNGTAAAPDGINRGVGVYSSPEAARLFLQSYGKPKVVNYPDTQMCGDALDKGQYCVLGRRKRACKPGLICFRCACHTGCL